LTDAGGLRAIREPPPLIDTKDHLCCIQSLENMQYLLIALTTFFATAVAQTTSSFDLGNLGSGPFTQCISACQGVIDISDQCSNSTGYDFGDDVTKAQAYLGCICSSANSGPLNSYDLVMKDQLTIGVSHAPSKMAEQMSSAES
jgi:hypothetical protein